MKSDNLSLYTVVFDFRGGTYISQVHAADENEAFVNWASQLSVLEIQSFDEKHKNKLIDDTKNKDCRPVLLSGLTNVWCATCSFTALINIIKTDEQTS